MMENNVRNLIKGLGISPELQGYRYIIVAIEEICKSGDPARMSYTNLYSSLAKKFDTTPAATERLIRHAIAKVFETPEGIAHVENILDFHFINGHVTNSQFLALCAEMILENFDLPDLETSE